MAGEFGTDSNSSDNRSRTKFTDLEPPDPDRKSPKFITEETQFVGSGATPRVARHRRSRSRSGTRIAPSALSISDEHFYEDLEEYVKMSRETAANPGPAEPDVWTQLQQKESDLLLAAELGKALLEKNEELKREQDRIAEEYSKKLEVSDESSAAKLQLSARLHPNFTFLLVSCEAAANGRIHTYAIFLC
ncbi:Bicaudal D-related protein homolog [Eumeta japonica]|uniref:Bicaudal D-related protein homolog n=1 Tax=Eumeta variegata TaxID=151549 RepID=A0A4C1Z077_EUMVA|nr:Bicaudal D-related protein homolog [Eumeta japonica]